MHVPAAYSVNIRLQGEVPYSLIYINCFRRKNDKSLGEFYFPFNISSDAS